MAGSRPSADGLGAWLAGGLVVGAILLFVIVLAYGLGRNSVTPAPTTSTGVPRTTTPASTAPTPASPSPTPAASAVVGKALFEQTCGGCHMQAGTAGGGVGPKLQGMGLPQDAIVKQIENGGGPMPGGLVSGTDLQNVVAYVLSLQH